jgi:hypothetical protein
MYYVLANRASRSITIDGLGILQPSEVRKFTSEDAEGFEHIRGVKLLGYNVPEEVDLVVVVEEGDK